MPRRGARPAQRFRAAIPKPDKTPCRRRRRCDAPANVAAGVRRSRRPRGAAHAPTLLETQAVARQELPVPPPPSRVRMARQSFRAPKAQAAHQTTPYQRSASQCLRGASLTALTEPRSLKRVRARRIFRCPRHTALEARARRTRPAKRDTARGSSRFPRFRASLPRSPARFAGWYVPVWSDDRHS